MTFLNPWAFLWLLAVPPLIALYFLKLKRPEIKVPSTLLWRKVIEDLRVNSPFQKLRRSLLLLLQLAALILAVLALAQPLLRVRETRSESLIVLLDVSASMSAKEADGRTRLDMARKEIQRLCDNLSREDEAMLIAFHRRARVVQVFTGNRNLMREALNGIQPTDGGTAVEPALLLAQSIANTRPQPRILLFSDGAFPVTEGFELPTEIEYRKIGTSRPNVAITGLDIRRSLTDRNRIEMFMGLENFSGETFSGNLLVELDGKLVDTQYVALGPLETLSQIFETALPEGGILHVRLAAEDALACDNEAWQIVSPPRQRRALLVGENPFFLERILKASQGMEYQVVPAAAYEAKEAERFSAVIWNAVPNPKAGPGHHIFLGCAPEAEGITTGKAIQSPDILDWDNTHPINRFIDFDNLMIGSAHALSLPPQSKTLLQSVHTPLIALLETEQAIYCMTAFDPLQSNWPLLVSFPLFINNCLDYFDQQQARKFNLHIAVGDVIRLPARNRPLLIRGPSGGAQPLNPNPSGDFSFADTEKAGLYRIECRDSEALTVAANAFDRAESLIEPVESLKIGRQKIKALEARQPINRDYWKPLIALVCLLLAAEWVVYHRRLFA